MKWSSANSCTRSASAVSSGANRCGANRAGSCPSGAGATRWAAGLCAASIAIAHSKDVCQSPAEKEFKFAQLENHQRRRGRAPVGANALGRGRSAGETVGATQPVEDRSMRTIGGGFTTPHAGVRTALATRAVCGARSMDGGMVGGAWAISHQPSDITERLGQPHQCPRTPRGPATALHEARLLHHQAAKFFSSLADNALFIGAVELKSEREPSWQAARWCLSRVYVVRGLRGALEVRCPRPRSSSATSSGGRLMLCVRQHRGLAVVCSGRGVSSQVRHPQGPPPVAVVKANGDRGLTIARYPGHRWAGSSGAKHLSAHAPLTSRDRNGHRHAPEAAIS